jgi:hypothetical protein
MARLRVGEILVSAGVITRDQLGVALSEQKRWGGRLGKIFVAKRFMSEETLVQALSRQLGIELIDLDGIEIPPEVLRLVPADLVQRHVLLPFRQQGSFLDVAMSDPLNLEVSDQLRALTQKHIRPFLAPESAIQRAIHAASAIRLADGTGLRHRPAPDPEAPRSSSARGGELADLRERVAMLEAQVARKDDVLRTVLRLLIDKGVASREEIVAALG